MLIDTQKQVGKYLRYGLFSICLVWIAGLGVAQDQDEALSTYTWPRGGLTVDYPEAGWQVDVDADYFGVTNGDLRIDFYPSEFLPTPPQSTRDILSLMVRNMRTRGEIPTNDTPQAIRVGGFAAERLNYRSDVFDGFYLAVAVQGNQFWLVDAYRQDRRMDGISEQTALSIIDTMRFPPSAELFADGNLVLENYPFASELIIRELEQARVIPTGGALIFQEDFVVGDLTQGGIIDDYFGSDLVMGALVAFDRTPQSGEPALCGLLGRASDNSLTDGEGTFLLVALREETEIGSILQLEFDEENNSGINKVYLSGIDTQETIHLLVVVQEAEATIFVNGQQVDEPQPLIVTSDNQQSWAGFALESGCVMSNVWAYDLP